MIKTVIFELDGLMFDTKRLNKEAWFAAAEKMGVTISEQMINEMYGKVPAESDQIICKYMGDDFNMEYLKTLRQEYINQYLEENGVPVKKGLRELLSYLKTHGYRVALATDAIDTRASSLMRKADVQKYFDYMVYGNVVENDKPAPDMFLLACRKAYVAPEECLALEESLNGVKAARAAGCRVILIPDGSDSTESEEESRKLADSVMNSLEDVLLMLKETA